MDEDVRIPSAATGPEQERDALRAQLQAIEQRLVALEHRQAQMPAVPNTNLLSGSFLTRAFAVLGHNFVASLLVTIPLYIIIFVIILFVGVSLSGM